MSATGSGEGVGDWFDSLAGVGWQPGLERIEALVAALGRPQDAFRSIHVVGTNGKTSTTLYAAAMIAAGGRRAGAMTSPHLEDWTERVRVNGEAAGKAQWSDALGSVRDVIGKFVAEVPSLAELTQFEVATAAGFLLLARAEVEVAVIEAGLGGRLDATNVIPSEVTVLTSVGLDHTEWLGPTVTGIAREKLAVLRPGTVLVTGPLDPEVAAIASARAGELGCRRVEVAVPPPGPGLPPGPFARLDLALAAAAVSELTGEGVPVLTEAEVAGSGLMARLEVVGSDPRLVVDVAHNPDGISALAEAIGEVAGEGPLVVVFGCLDDRDPLAMLEPLAGRVEGLYACLAPAGGGPPGRGALDPGAIARAAGQLGIRAEVVPEPKEAIRRAEDEVARSDGAVLVCGSHGLAAAARSLQR